MNETVGEEVPPEPRSLEIVLAEGEGAGQEVIAEEHIGDVENRIDDDQIDND